MANDIFDNGDSFQWIGTLAIHDSFRIYGTLPFLDSFRCGGTFIFFDSFVEVDTIDK